MLEAIHKEILGNDGKMHKITQGQYLSYLNNKFIKTNESGQEVLNIFVDEEEKEKIDEFEKHKKKDEKNISDLQIFKNKTPGEAGAKIARELFPEAYNRILLILDTYMDMNDKDKKICALWIIGTYFHKEFNSFPRLFINAMKGSGKSRLLQIIKCLSWNGSVQANLTEAVLFRSASQRTLLFDESESISSKEKGVMRELLNAGYKKGVEVTRLKKVKTKEGEEQQEESFDLYGPVGLANINGVEDVLSDRAITLILEKSNDPQKTKLIEDYEGNIVINDIKRTLDLILVYKCSVVMPLESTVGMNVYTLNYTHTHNTYTTLTTQQHPLYKLPLMVSDTPLPKFTLTKKEMDFYKQIHELGIAGRDLELFLPLFSIAEGLGADVLSDVMVIAKEYVENKQQEDHIENRDWSLIDFIARYPSTLNFIPVNQIVNEFKDFYNGDDVDWLNSRWIGRSLRRLNLTVDKRRLGRGVEYILNGAKAKAQMEAFKND